MPIINGPASIPKPISSIITASRTRRRSRHTLCCRSDKARRADLTPDWISSMSARDRVLIPVLVRVTPCATLTAWEYSEATSLARGGTATQTSARNGVIFGVWSREAYGPKTCRTIPFRPASQSRISAASIFELPERNWNAATMFFCAELITARQDEFEAACVAFARSLSPAACWRRRFWSGRPAYIVADRRFRSSSLNDGIDEPIFSPNAMPPVFGRTNRHPRTRDPQRLFGLYLSDGNRALNHASARRKSRE